MPENLIFKGKKIEESKQGVATNLMMPWYAFVLRLITYFYPLSLV
jgi:hypothetical protein